MRREPVFPPLLLRMVIMGETTGNLDAALQNVSDYYNDIIPRKIKKILTMLEPALTLFMIFLVGCIALSIYLPILALMGAIHSCPCKHPVGRNGVRLAPCFLADCLSRIFSRSAAWGMASFKVEAGRDVFGGTPNTACETPALPGIAARSDQLKSFYNEPLSLSSSRKAGRRILAVCAGKASEKSPAAPGFP